MLIAAFAALTIYAYTANVSVVSAASPCPAVNDWCTTMTVADAEGDGILHGYEFDKFGSIVDDTIQPGGANINVWTVHAFAHPAPHLPDYIYFGSFPRVPRGTQVTIEGHTFIADAESDDGFESDRWDFPSGELPASLVWSAGQEVTVSVKLAFPCDNLDNLDNLVNAIVVKNLTGEIDLPPGLGPRDPRIQRAWSYRRDGRTPGAFGYPKRCGDGRHCSRPATSPQCDELRASS